MSSWVNCHLGQLFPWAKKHCWKNSCGSGISGRALLRGRRKPATRSMIHEQPTPIEKAPATTTTSKISGLIQYYLQEQDFYVGVQTKRGCPHNCCYCIYTVVEGKQVRINPGSEAEMQQLYNRAFVTLVYRCPVHPRPLTSCCSSSMPG